MNLDTRLLCIAFFLTLVDLSTSLKKEDCEGMYLSL